MDGAWWRQRQELDADQQSIISLPLSGKYLILGPPGSGKTNLLVLRSAFLVKSGFVDQMFLTFGGVLSAFITTGARELDPLQVSTFSKWASRIASERRPGFAARIRTAGEGLIKSARFDAQRTAVADECVAAISAPAYSKQIHQAIQVDEVQDLHTKEMHAIFESSPRLMVAGDIRQSIFHGNAIATAIDLGLSVVTLKNHYRIGTAIAEIADKLQPPASPAEALAATTKYDESINESRAEYYELPSRHAQFDLMIMEIRSQLRAYPGEAIAIFIARRVAFDELRELFFATDLYPAVTFHEQADVVNFSTNSRIHVLTVAGAKGTEFRAVHLFGCEDAQGAQDTAEFWYTAVTRAKTTLLAYATPGRDIISRRLVSAFALDQNPTIDSLF